jgi:hypothetical protein
MRKMSFVQKTVLVLALLGMTGFNVLYSAPWVAQACSCLNSNGTTKCTGNCCGGPGDTCDCYDTGTDNCKAASEEEFNLN